MHMRIYYDVMYMYVYTYYIYVGSNHSYLRHSLLDNSFVNCTVVHFSIGIGHLRVYQEAEGDQY